MSRVIGIDIGTTTLCGCVLCGETGDLLDLITLPNRSSLPGKPWQSLQNPILIIKDLLALYDHLYEAHAPVTGIGITGQMHGIVYVDVAGRLVSPLVTWQDGRGELLRSDDESYAAFLNRITDHTLATGYGVVTHYYNSLNGLVPADASTFCTIGDALALALTGSRTPLLHPSNAAGLGLYDLERRVYDVKALTAAGLDPALFPPIASDESPVGVTAQGVPVMPAIGDNQASFIGSVRNMADSLLVNMGTGSQISCRTHQRIATPSTESRPLTDGDYLWVGSSLCGGRAFAQLEAFIRSIVNDNGVKLSSLYPYMDALSKSAFELDDPLTVNTSFCGTRQDPFLRGSITNLSVHNFSPTHLVVGVLQGTVTELVEMYRMVEPQLQHQPHILVGSGNGLRKSPVWRELFSHRLDMPMRVPAHKEEAAYGAALFALNGSGTYPNLQAAQQLIRYVDGH